MAKNRRPQTLPIGTISEGTLRPEDLIDSLAWELRRLRLSRADRATFRELMRDADRAGDKDPDVDLSEISDELFQLAESYVPDRCYLGSTEGDGALIGVWPIVPEPDEVTRVESLSELPRGFSGEVLQVSDHGNCTLYAVSHGRAREIWSVV